MSNIIEESIENSDVSSIKSVSDNDESISSLDSEYHPRLLMQAGDKPTAEE